MIELSTFSLSVIAQNSEVQAAPSNEEQREAIPDKGVTASDVLMEQNDTEEASKAPLPSVPTPSQTSGLKPMIGNKAPAPTYPGGFAIDVCFEASKLPLDVAIFNSARAAGGDEKIRKYLQAVLVVGGTALIPGMAHALESRYGPYFSADCIFKRNVSA
jgi:actin-related protein 8